LVMRGLAGVSVFRNSQGIALRSTASSRCRIWLLRRNRGSEPRKLTQPGILINSTAGDGRV
jgi:hypothetical protein